MSDLLKSNPVMQTKPTLAAIESITTLTDNHGNSIKGNIITCARKPAEIMSYDDADAVYRAIGFYEDLNFRFDGEISMIFGMESPLQGLCRKLDAQAHHAQRSASPTQNK